MSRKKKIMTAATTFCVALGIGFIMQYGDAVASRLQIAPDADTFIAADLVSPQQASLIASLAIPTAMAAPLNIPVPVRIVALDDAASRLTDVTTIEAVPHLACAVSLGVTVLPLATVALAIDAPCQIDAPVTIHHQGMMFTVMTDGVGTRDILVPAMSQDAFFIASFADGAGAVASVSVPELVQFDRAALQWQGVDAVQLHALEFGAGYGGKGHIWAATEGVLDFVNPPSSGFLVRLGDDTRDVPLMAEIYTFPTGAVLRDGRVALSVEAEVTAANCGRDVNAQSIQFNPLSAPTAIDLTMTMPGCDAIGEFLVLKNMFRDLTIASK